MEYSRRDFALILPGIAALAAAPEGHAAEISVLPAKAYPFAELKATTHDGNSFREIVNGLTHENFPLEIHETTLAPGAMPHPPHHHPHEEVFLIREGTLEASIGGKSTRLGAGSAAYVASNVEHGVRNVGSDPAQYFVVELGHQGKS